MSTPSAMDIVQTWRVVEQHRFGRPDSVYSELILGEMLRDAAKLITQFEKTECKPADYGQAIRNAADKLEAENPGKDFLRLTRRQVVEQMNAIVSARRVAALSPLTIGDGKDGGVDRAPTGLIWLQEEFPVLWSNWREFGDILPMPAFWQWQRNLPAENKAMPLIVVEVIELLKDESNAHYIDIGKTITANRANEAMEIAADFHKVPDHLQLRHFSARKIWNESTAAEVAAEIKSYNVNRVKKMEFDPVQALNDGRMEAFAFIYGKIKFEQQ